MNKKNKILICIVGTNSYLPLAIRFIKKFIHHYKGKSKIHFSLFTDECPKKFLSDKEAFCVSYTEQHHDSWVNGINSKFRNILQSLENHPSDYVFYFDADTSISHDFDESWFLGRVVAGEHFSNRESMVAFKPFDQYPRSSCYVNPLSNLHREYYYGAFFGGETICVKNICLTIIRWQDYNKKIKHEPIWNDESYLNAYLHYNKPTRIIPTEDFAFHVSNKGDLGYTRNVKLNISELKEEMIKNKDSVYDITEGKVKAINESNI